MFIYAKRITEVESQMVKLAELLDDLVNKPEKFEGLDVKAGIEYALGALKHGPETLSELHRHELVLSHMIVQGEIPDGATDSQIHELVSAQYNATKEMAKKVASKLKSLPEGEVTDESVMEIVDGLITETIEESKQQTPMQEAMDEVASILKELGITSDVVYTGNTKH